MDKQLWMVICGISALGLYSLSWVFRLMAWPGSGYLRIAAVIPFVVGAVIWWMDWRKKNNARASRGEKKKTGWEDILEEEEDKGE